MDGIHCSLKGLIVEITEKQMADIKLWCSHWIEEGKKCGRKVNLQERLIAQSMGVKNIDDIIIVLVSEMPSALESFREYSEEFLNVANASGLTLGHVVLIKHTEYSVNLVKHEFCHVRQVEMCGGWENFLEKYLQEIVQFGYNNSPLEVEARLTSIIC